MRGQIYGKEIVFLIILGRCFYRHTQEINLIPLVAKSNGSRQGLGVFPKPCLCSNQRLLLSDISIETT